MTNLSSGAIANMLRSWNHCWPAPWLEKTVADAADRLDAQTAEIERLRGVLSRIAESDDMHEPAGWAIHSARTALAPRMER